LETVRHSGPRNGERGAACAFCASKMHQTLSDASLNAERASPTNGNHAELGFGSWIMIVSLSLPAWRLCLPFPRLLFLLARQHQVQLPAPVFFLKSSQHPDTVRTDNLPCWNALLIRSFQQPANACQRFTFTSSNTNCSFLRKSLAAQFGIVHVQNHFHIIPRQTPNSPVSFPTHSSRSCLPRLFYPRRTGAFYSFGGIYAERVYA